MKKKPFDWRKILKDYMMVILLIAIFVISSFLNPAFLTRNNLINILRQVAIYALITFPITCLIICGMTDLSAGSLCALAGVGGVHLYISIVERFSPTLAFLIALGYALLIGFFGGAINGFIVTRLKVPAFMATLATMEAYRGMALLYTGGNILYGIGDFSYFGQGMIGWLPVSVIIMFVLFLVFVVVLKKTVYGRSLYAVGGNEEAARASGIHVEKSRMKAFIIEGVMCGLAGVVLMGRLNSGQPTAASGYEFDAIIGAILGGTSFSGGVGSIFGSLIGVIIVGTINNILQLCGVQSYIHQILKGVIIITAVAIDMTGKHRKGKQKKLAKPAK